MSRVNRFQEGHGPARTAQQGPREVDDPATSFTCPRCGWTSHHPHDVAERYCGHCHVFVDDPLLVTQGVGFARVDERDGVLDPFAPFGQEPDWSDGQFQRDGVLDIRRISADKDRE